MLFVLLVHILHSPFGEESGRSVVNVPGCEEHLIEDDVFNLVVFRDQLVIDYQFVQEADLFVRQEKVSVSLNQVAC